MSILFTLPYKMTTYYSIHAYDQHSHYHHREDRIEDGKLYATFENACEVIEKKIQSHIEYFNSWEYEEEFKPPNREEMKQKMGKYVHYYETQAGWLWVISKWDVVVEEKKKVIGKCWYCGDEGQEIVKDGMCLLCSLK